MSNIELDYTNVLKFLTQEEIDRLRNQYAETPFFDEVDTSKDFIEYKESGIQLSSNERAGIDKLKYTIQNNPNIDCVICWELSRIARRADVIYEIRDFFLNNKIQWVVMTPYMRLLESDGKMSQTSSIMLGLFTSLAESEMAIKESNVNKLTSCHST